MMIQRPDITAYSSDGSLQLVVEINNKKGSNAEWAATMRRNLFVHSVVPYSPYFLLALPDYFYLWKNVDTLDIKLPDYTVNAKPILEPYLNNSSQNLNTISEYGLELIINSWLNKLINTALTKETVKPYETWLLDSKLYNAIKHGYIKTTATI